MGRNQDGRLEAFVRGVYGKLWHKWQTLDNDWSDWFPLEAPPPVGNAIYDPAVILDAFDQLHVFVRDADDALWYKRQNTPNGGWDVWRPLGGVLRSGPAVGRNEDGRLEVFVRGENGKLWHKWQMTSGSGTWSDWDESLDGIVYDPVVIESANRCLEVIVRGVHDKFWRIRQTAPNNGWSPWELLSGCFKNQAGINLNREGFLEVFGRGADDALWQRYVPSGWPGSGSIQSYEAFAVGNTVIQGFWRGDQGFARSIPVVDGEVRWASASAWQGPFSLSTLPGSGSIQAQDSYILNDTIHQAFWRGGEGWSRTVPVINGEIKWDQGSKWQGPIPLE